MSGNSDLKCFSCGVELSSEKEFWHHLEVDCTGVDLNQNSKQNPVQPPIQSMHKSTHPATLSPPRNDNQSSLNYPNNLNQTQKNGDQLSNEWRRHRNLNAKNENVDDITVLLRRICLTEMLSVIHNVGNSDSELSQSKQLHLSTREQELTNLFRSICREEIQKVLGPELISQIRNVKLK